MRLKVAVPETVVVRIANNEYQNLIDGIDGLDRTTKQDRFVGYSRIEALLRSDPDVIITPQNSDEQTIDKGKRYRQWTWKVTPKTTGKHALTLLVRGVNRGEYEDYDPEAMEYEVEWNLKNWLFTNFQQNGATWIWVVVSGFVSSFFTWLATKGKRKSQVNLDV